MTVCVFDTETTSLDKPYCYNVGYCIADPVSGEILLKREFVVEQIWHNLALFNTAYYANKRSLYVSAMRSRKAIMEKFGYITQQMYRDFKAFDTQCAFAFNSSFDEKVFSFNCDWFKVINPFDSIPVYDIRGYVHRFLIDDEYKRICDEHQYYSESGNYSTTAETVYRIVFNNHGFIEDHTALSDSLIEKEILFKCFEKGAEIDGNYPALKSITREVPKLFSVKRDGNTIFSSECISIRYLKTKNEIILK